MSETKTMRAHVSEQSLIRAERIKDAMRWVTQEAKAGVMAGMEVPNGCRLREALKQLEAAYATQED